MEDFVTAPHTGIKFTSKLHKKAEGPTDPQNNKLPKPFVVLVTGAGKGLGYHISLAYAYAGATGLVISSRTKADLEKLEDELKGINSKLEILSRTCDTTSDDEVERLAAETKAKFNRLDVVVANAGIISKYLCDDDGSNRRLPVGTLQDLDFNRVIDINLLGTVRVARLFLPMLFASGGSGQHRSPQAFTVISSLAAHAEDGQTVPTAYSTSKLAVNRLVEQLHNDYHADHGLLAFAVHPGGVITPQTQGHVKEKGDMWEAMLSDDVGLCGGFLTWLTSTRREWLSGRYLSATWDVDELEAKKNDIVKGDKLKFRMVV